MAEQDPVITLTFKERAVTLEVDFVDWQLVAVRDEESGFLYARFLVTYRAKGTLDEHGLYVSSVKPLESGLEVP